MPIAFLNLKNSDMRPHLFQMYKLLEYHITGYFWSSLVVYVTVGLLLQRCVVALHCYFKPIASKRLDLFDTRDFPLQRGHVQ